MLPVRLFNLIFHLCSVRPAVLMARQNEEVTQGGEGKKMLVFQKRGWPFSLAINRFPCRHPPTSFFLKVVDQGLSINVTDLHVRFALASCMATVRSHTSVVRFKIIGKGRKRLFACQLKANFCSNPDTNSHKRTISCAFLQYHTAVDAVPTEMDGGQRKFSQG